MKMEALRKFIETDNLMLFRTAGLICRYGDGPFQGTYNAGWGKAQYSVIKPIARTSEMAAKGYRGLRSAVNKWRVQNGLKEIPKDGQVWTHDPVLFANYIWGPEMLKDEVLRDRWFGSKENTLAVAKRFGRDGHVLLPFELSFNADWLKKLRWRHHEGYPTGTMQVIESSRKKVVADTAQPGELWTGFFVDSRLQSLETRLFIPIDNCKNAILGNDFIMNTLLDYINSKATA